MSASSLPADDEGLRAEHALVARIGTGDVEALTRLYDLYGARVMRFLVDLSVDHQAAEDLVQETFLRVWGAAGRFRPEGRVSTWIFQIAKRLWWKRATRRRQRPIREGEAALRHNVGRRPPDPLGRAATSDEVSRLQAALEELSPKLRLVFVLVRLHELPYAEVAEVVGLRLGTVKSRMAAAEAKLRKLLDA